MLSFSNLQTGGLFAEHLKCPVCNQTVYCGRNILICPDCQQLIRSESLAGVDFEVSAQNSFIGWAPFYYQGIFRRIISLIKFRRSFRLLEIFIPRLVNHFNQSRFDFIVPVPGRLLGNLKRGYDVAEQIAAQLSRGLNIPQARLVNRKLFCGPAQKTKTQQQRLTFVDRYNLKLFRRKILNSAPNILLVDDLVASGGTLLEISQLLQNSGAGQITVAALVKTRYYK